MTTQTDSYIASTAISGQAREFALLVVFRLGDHEYALPIEQVDEVLRMVALTPLPRAHEWLVGVINLRGQIIPIIDLRKRLALPVAPYGLNTPIIVAQVDDTRVGLIADAVSEVMTVSANAVAAANALAEEDSPAAGIARVDDHLVMILDLSRVVIGAEAGLTT